MGNKPDNLETRRQTANWGLLPRILLVAVLLLPALSVVPRAEAAPRVQPQLLAMAAQHPDSTVGVIVQKTSGDKSVESLVARVGGRITKDLHIINAFAADMPGKAVQTVAQADGVRWVSLDSPVVKSVCSACINTSNLLTSYDKTVRADSVWNAGPGYVQGQGIGVAVVDSGVANNN